MGLGRRRLRTSSRAELLWMLCGFVGLQLAIAVAIESKLPQWRDPAYAFRAARLIRRTAVPERPLTVVMLGSSRVFFGLKGQVLEEELSRRCARPVVVFNFGTMASGPVTSLMHLRRLDRSGVHPDLLFVEATPPMLVDQGHAPAEAGLFRADVLWREELDLLARYNLPADELRREWLRSWLVPCYAHRFNIVSAWVPTLLPRNLRQDGARDVDDWGWRNPSVSQVPPAWKQEWMKRNLHDFAPSLQKFRLGEPACRALDDLLAFARARAMSPILVWMPEPTQLRRCYAPETLTCVRTFLSNLGQRHGAPVVEARDWVADEQFMDGLHLLAGGAEQFSRRLGREVMEPALARLAHPPTAVAVAQGASPPASRPGQAPNH